MASTLSITSPADFHVHLRQGSMAALVTPHVRKGGFNLAYVMVWSDRVLQGHILTCC
jgi:dihydroorotase